MHNQHKINEVLDALGDEQLTTKEILSRLVDFEISSKALTWFIRKRMVGRYVAEERVYSRPPYTWTFWVIAR